MNSKKGFDIFSLIIGLFSLYVGYLVIKNPITGLLSIVITIGIFALIRGIYQLYLSYKLRKWTDKKVGWLIFSGIVDILLGIIFMFNLALGLQTLILIFAIWFIIDGIAELSLAPIYDLAGKSYRWLIIVLAVLSIIAGIILLFRPLLASVLIVSLAAIYFFVAGILEIVEAF
ncbi:HdeD family acid-resistance protein [Bombilactobacillus thymidiniphilus]|uniref:DUF308 domain-containing protein n=1 Tax=Bombilactobacillus thymidiniphilus TaxID=2923363 RepID=A0ABY4PC03_9LACO|nr:DUF308 domain-containing protein [Bombilactobacillus thymidiniphilus]UQS83174.1 DUF308 domain-containing protein [Bombilactobacillus thymidiniphilus]